MHTGAEGRVQARAEGGEGAGKGERGSGGKHKKLPRKHMARLLSTPVVNVQFVLGKVR